MGCVTRKTRGNLYKIASNLELPRLSMIDLIHCHELEIGFTKHKPVLFIPELTIQSGHIVPLVGENGSGKTTLLKTFAGLRRSLSGQLNPNPFKRNAQLMLEEITYIPSHPQFFDKLTVSEHLQLVTILSKKATSIEMILDHFQLSKYQNTFATKLSAGQKKCLALACLSLKRPKLLLLDEPSCDLDEEHRQLLHRTLYDLGQKGTACLFSTHQIQDLRYYHDILKIESNLLSWHSLKQSHSKGNRREILTSAEA